MNATKSILCLALMVTICFLCQCTSSKSDLPEEIDFNYHVRPILSQNCFTCHGPDPSSRKGNLRLDTQEGASQKLSNGNRAIVPRRPGKSSLLERVYADDESLVMPPPESKKTLSDREKGILEKWIKQGAKWKKHWAFIPPQNSKLEYEAIDDYISQEIALKGLTKAEEADRSTLIRRISYILTGLPPSVKELEDLAFVEYHEVVDHYLNSKHFGEHWARHWMDLVRYAEGMGHEFDYSIGGAWHYRDYLIRAFNHDVPYIQLVTEHLAGDLLESPRMDKENGVNESIIGTAYAFLGEGKHSPVDIKQEEAVKIDNLIDVTSKTFQGLTVSCAKCHDHKFDPIPTKDYYAMYGMFESTRITPVAFKTQAGLESVKDEIIKIHDDLEDRITSFIDSVSLDLELPHANLLADFKGKDFGSWVTTGEAFGKQPLHHLFASSQTYGRGRLGTLRSPNFELRDSFIYVYASGEGATIRVIVDNFQLIQNPLYGSLMKRVNNSGWKLYKLDVSQLKGHKAYIEMLPGIYDRHQFEIGSDNYIEVRQVFTSNTSISDLEKYEVEAIAWSKSEQKKVDQMIAYGEELFDSSYVMAMSEGDAVYSPVFIRGDHQQLSEEDVPHGFISALDLTGLDFAQEGSGRLDWAEAIVDESNPLTSRVIVNRIWHYIFGRGIVETVDNFGLQGSLPSHPELLDFLSMSMIEDNWSVKSTIKKIMLSETFQRASTFIESNAEKDPQNIYLASFPIKRLEAESIRDGVLKVAGSLNDKMYGPSVPIHLTEFMSGRGRPAVSGPLDGEGRRSLYVSVKRNFLSPMMLTFDRPIPFSTFGKRNVTNVPAQSLFLMNDPFVHEQAQKWAERLITQVPDNFEKRVELIHLSAYGRKPTKQEIEKAVEITKDLDCGSEMELWKNYCHLIFNTKEFIHLM